MSLQSVLMTRLIKVGIQVRSSIILGEAHQSLCCHSLCLIEGILRLQCSQSLLTFVRSHARYCSNLMDKASLPTKNHFTRSSLICGRCQATCRIFPRGRAVPRVNGAFTAPMGDPCVTSCACSRQWHFDPAHEISDSSHLSIWHSVFASFGVWGCSGTLVTVFGVWRNLWETSSNIFLILFALTLVRLKLDHIRSEGWLTWKIRESDTWSPCVCHLEELLRVTIRFRIAMSANETPRKTGEKITRVIDQLNSRWNLQLPRLHGIEARDAKNADDVQRKCSSRIRAACWLNNVNMNSVMEDFEDRATSIYTAWICMWRIFDFDAHQKLKFHLTNATFTSTVKPSQQSGTLPRLPVTKLSSKDFALSRSRDLTPEQRRQLCEALLNLIDDECKLAHESDAYSRTSAISNPTISANPSVFSAGSSTAKTCGGPRSTGSFYTACDKNIEPDPKLLMSSTRTSTDGQSSKKRAASAASLASTKVCKISACILRVYWCIVDFEAF